MSRSATAAVRTERDGDARADGVRVLVVDDEPTLRRLVARWLTEAGFVTTMAENGKMALLTLQDHCFDLVVSDVRMPQMSGTTLLAQLSTEQPELPVILMSGSPEVLPADVLALGAFDFLQKPVQRELLLTTVLRATGG